jgi:glycosyltransferase involved in cell wall biosynthesis
MSSSLLAVLPGYNVARYLPDLIPRIQRIVPDAGVCLVDDGSADDTADCAEGLGATVLRHPGNRGKGEALKTGFEHAVEHDFAAVLTLDADGQHLPEEIPRFVASWRSGHAVVVGSRMQANENMPWLRKRTNEVTSAIVSRLAGQEIEDSQSGYRLIDTQVLRRITLESSRYDLESEILIKAGRLGYSIGAVPITSVYHDQESSINPFVDTLRFLRLLWRARRWR